MDATVASALFAAGVLCVVAAVLAAIWKVRQVAARIDVLANDIARLRSLPLQTVRYVPAAGEHVPAGDRRSLYDDAAGELAAIGFTSLGDHAEIGPNGEFTGVMRWFVDAGQGTSAWFAVVSPRGNAQPTHWSGFFSETTAGGFVVTVSGAPRPRVAWPPDVRTSSVALPLAGVLAAHRASEGGVPLVVASTAADVAASRLRFRNYIAAWRVAQPAAALLDADLRLILGQRYEALHQTVALKLAKLPA